MDENTDKKPGFEAVGISMHTSVKALLKQYVKECGVNNSVFVSDLIKNYGPAQKKKYLPEA